MCVRVHDLLRVGGPNDLVADGAGPRWLNDSLRAAPWVVVRRAPAIGGLVPIGVRGSRRAERFAAFLPESSIIERIMPEELALLPNTRRNHLPAFSALSELQTVFRGLGIFWGPAGSVGFELATGAHAVKPTSDLDVIIRQTDFGLSPAVYNRLLTFVERTEVAVDILVETGAGGFSFLDYAKGGETLVVRTQKGPREILHPMNRIPADSRAGHELE